MPQGVGKRLNPAERELIVDLYSEGASSEALAKQFGVSGVAVRKTLARRGVVLRDARECHRTCELNESVFDSITRDSAYWIGMLITDGYIMVKERAIGMALMESDREHVEKFKAFLGSTHSIQQKKKQKAVCLSVKSPRLVAAVAQYGVSPRKSFTAEVCPELAHDRDFWRGVIDGNGSIQHYETGHCPMLSLVGSERIVQQFEAFCAPYLGGYPLKTRICGHSPVWYATMHGNAAMTMLQVLYKNASPVLARKKVEAEALLERYAGHIFRTLKKFTRTTPTLLPS